MNIWYECEEYKAVVGGEYLGREILAVGRVYRRWKNFTCEHTRGLKLAGLYKRVKLGGRLVLDEVNPTDKL